MHGNLLAFDGQLMADLRILFGYPVNTADLNDLLVNISKAACNEYNLYNHCNHC